MDRLKQIEQLRQSLNDLRGRSVSLKKNFAVFGEAVDAEKFVTSKTLTSLGDEFFGWMNAEALCLKKYAQLFTGGKPQNMPQTFSDIEEVLDAEEKKIRETSVVFQAERFLHFTTNNPDLKKILLGHQKELSKLLDRKRQGVKFKSIIEPYAKFFKVAIETDFGKKFAASKDLSATFDDDFIGRGIFGGELIFTDDAPTTKPIDEPTTKPADEPTTKPIDEPTTKPADELTLEPVVKVRKKPGRKPKAKPVDEKISAPVEEPTAAVEESDFVKIIKSKDALLTESDFAQWEKLFTVDKKDRTKKFSAVQFKREFPNADMMKPVLTHTALHGMLIAPELCPRKMPTDIVENFALSLVKKGYLQQYTVEGFVNFYGLTKNFFDFARTDTGKKFITAKPSERNKIDTTSFLEVDLFRAVTRAAYMKLRNIEKEHERLFYEAEFGGQWFRADFAIKDEHDTIIGCFWDTPDECDKFIRRMKNYFKKTIAPLTRVIVVSLTWLNAVKIFDALKESLPEIFPKDAAQYLYALNDDAFYRGGSTEKISADEIWKTTSPEPTDDPQPEKISDDDADVDDAAAEQNELSTTNAAVKNFLLNKKFYCATAYLKAQTLTEEDAHIYRQLAFAVDDPFINEGYSANAISILASKSDTKFNEALITAAALRALFYNDFIGDHGVPILHAQVSNFDLVKKNAPLAELIDELKNFKATVMKGVDLYADYKTQDKASTEKKLAKIIGDATDYHTRFFEGHFTDSADNETFIRMQKIIFDRKGDFAQVFRLIKDKSEIKSADTLQLVKDFLTETFLQEGATVEAVNIDENKLEKIIDDGWDAASDRKNPGKVLGKLRNNITKNLERAVEIMCAWVNCAEIFSTTGEDAGSIAYKKIRSRLLKNATDARDNLAAKIKTKTFEAAGVAVVDQTLQEISARLDGKYNPLAKKYFYVDFLRGDKIVLDENFLPKLDLNITDGTRENISEQIIAHAASKLPTFEERIEQIFEEGGDDFGSAQLIDDYLKFRDGSSFIEQRYDLQKCINSAAKDAPRRRESFIGGLELAQSYGQFDTMDEGEKEKILQLAENCYKYAEQSKNFGVFFRVKNYWEAVIHDNAVKRGETLKHELQAAVDNYKKVAQNFNASELHDSVEEIEKIIDSGNCTVAQSLIRKLSEGELYQKFDDTEETALSRFISDYDDCYNKVSDSGYSLENLVGKKIFPHDKVSRAKINLLKNWITNPIGEDRIKTLLELLGFDAESVQKIPSPANTIAFNVKISNAMQTKYYHPIAAFGSDAETDGFRVACLFGKYDEKDLISKFKELGNSKHTLIFLDYSLDLPTRRLLAKEIKLDKSLTKVFALVDRVAMMYLIKDCAAQIGSKRINDTLMALVMPFARYQPYIWSPRIPLPPEMFIGRETEINAVTNYQDGVNIVCGGRQLGKSALLKMARRKINSNGNELAIYLEITDKNYREAALLTSHELSDKKFFSEPIETDDWEELARAIRKRLSSDTPTKISYFLLMLDEADEFIESCADNKYSPIVELAKIQQENYDGSRFKFVIAGLRNIVRFEREKIYSDNIILPTLKSLTIKPFNLEDARKLLEVPLRYLGLYFPDGKKDSLILTILETANYFPSLIQLYCEKLLTALFETSYAGYNADTPIYEISEDHIKKVLADKEFVKDIKTKIEITLGLGKDNYYHTIANLLAYLYYKQNNLVGYSPQDILKAANDDFGLVDRKILPDSEEKIRALMDELCELNILRKSGESRYFFSRQRILRIVGTLDEVETALLKMITE